MTAQTNSISQPSTVRKDFIVFSFNHRDRYINLLKNDQLVFLQVLSFQTILLSTTDRNLNKK